MMKKRLLSLVLALVMIVSTLNGMSMLMVLSSIPVYADNGAVQISSASELPSEISAGTTYELAADITLAEGQQISSLAGVLDGKGHTITLAGKPLANTVTGVIQNTVFNGNVTTADFSAEGVVAINLDGGSIQSCASLATITGGKYADVGGFVGTMNNNATLKNSFFLGSATPGQYCTVGGASVYANGTNTISDFYFNSGTVTAYTSNSTTKTNCSIKAAEDFASANMVVLLNNDIEATGYIWELKENAAYPTLVAGTVTNTVNKSGLEATINSAKALVQDAYTSATWAKLEEALTTAETVYADEDATKQEVTAATAGLEEAINALEKKKATEPVAAPTDESQIVHIQNQLQLENVGSGNADKYYVLDNDISLDNWYMSYSEFNGVFDGNGHTITYNSSYTALFEKLGSNGVVQNVHFAGSLRAAGDYGAVAREVKGSVINCYSEITGEKASGFAKRLNGGMISNCYSVSKAGNGVILGSADDTYTGTLKNVYWQEDLMQLADLSKLTTDNALALRYSAITTLDFVGTLNKNKGQYGVSWGQNSNGYPYFGENQVFVPGVVELPETLGVELSFALKGEDAKKVENQEVIVDKNKADLTGYVGKFSLMNYDIPEGAEVVWECTDLTPEGVAAITTMNSMYAEDAGDFYVYKEGTLVVKAILKESNGNETVLAAAKVTTYAATIEAIKLYLADSDGTNATLIRDGKATVSGSEDKKIVVEAKYADSEIYQRVEATSFNFTMEAEEGVAKHSENSSSFSFNKPGAATMTVVYKNNNEVKASVEVTSEYVGVTSVAPGINGSFKLHQRDGNGSNNAPFVTIYANPVIVDPENASYKGDYTVTSSDNTIAEYIKSMANGFVPYKAGTVTFTTTINDNGNSVSGDSTVTFEYLNPLKSVTVTDNKITVKNGETVSAGLVFEGTTDTLTHVSETGMIWTYDKEGVVTVIREGGKWYNDGTEVNTGYFLSDKYNIKALSEGTVKVTGTPVDNTAGAQSVTFTVTVTPNENLQEADIWTMINDGISSSAAYLKKDLNNSPVGMIHGYEWHVTTLLRAGETIDETLLNDYYDAVVEEIKTWNGTEKPTDIERTALALAAMGKDITNVEDVNLAEMIYNSERLADGSNELTFALLALDALDTEIPEGAKWNRDSMIEALLKFQNKETGAFGLSDSEEASLDLTAMAIQALALYQEDTDVAKAIEDALAYLKTQISGNYDFDNNSNSTAQVLMAAAALKLDITDSENGFGNVYDNIVTRIDEYKAETGFRWMLEDENANTAATYQVMQAFDAYKKAMKENISYWDFGTAGSGGSGEGEGTDPEGPTPEEPTPTDSIDVYVTISDAGQVVVMQKPVEAKDRNEDGKIDVDEVLYEAHASFYPDGAAGYGSVMSPYGLSISRLWGDESGCFGYWLNDASCWSLADVVEEGDYLTAFIYKDKTGWSDAYTRFGKKVYAAVEDKASTVSLEIAGYDASWNTVFSDLEGASITAYKDGKEVAEKDYTVVETGDGKYEVTFADAGTYYLVSNNNKSAAASTGAASKTLVPAVCKVVCTEEAAAPTPEDKPVATPEDKPVVTPTPDKDNAGTTVNTGDSAPIMSFVGVMLFAGTVICLILKKKHEMI